MDIADFIAIEAQKPFRWGETDCVSTAGRWAQIRLSRFPLTEAGITYSDEAEATALIIENGGFPIFVNRVMRDAGFEKTKAPQAGDVGLILHAKKMCLAIHAHDFWFSRDETGLIGAPLHAIWKAWRMPCL